MCQSSKRENREIPSLSTGPSGRAAPTPEDRSENATGDNAEMNGEGKSDGFVVPAKPANKDATEASVESVEERDPAERNAQEAVLPRTQSRNNDRSRGLSSVREIRFRARLKAGAV